MISENKLVRFDWAMKYLLRDKSNFDILEGFLSALLNEDITVLSLAESESNREDENDKFNRVDLLVEDKEKRKFIIEIQNNRETHYLERLLYGTSKVIVENLSSGDLYRNVVKVLSISILYFDLGIGDDYIYYGNTEFRGVHTHKPLIVRERVYLPEVFEPKFRLKEKNVFPEYYLIRVEKFEDIIESPIDEWIYMIKHSEVKDSFHSKNINRAREKLNLMKMPEGDRRKYEKYLSNLASELDVMETAREEGRAEERKKTERERVRAEQEKQRAEQEKQRAEEEKKKREEFIRTIIQSEKFTPQEITNMFGIKEEEFRELL
ncbi:MAG: PD-(D/E)XK nuclease family transposase [Leptospiraceae bacterium]|nr:PD-(D/E)XK nuclease family transposase [Leptospiraceae bacterium]MCP5499098.1 PD-(D/E)XK nuclease family transposase [Leptospiraceae bacterium]